jgi:hypothetical protein
VSDGSGYHLLDQADEDDEFDGIPPAPLSCSDDALDMEGDSEDGMFNEEDDDGDEEGDEEDDDDEDEDDEDGDMFGDSDDSEEFIMANAEEIVDEEVPAKVLLLSMLFNAQGGKRLLALPEPEAKKSKSIRVETKPEAKPAAKAAAKPEQKKAEAKPAEKPKPEQKKEQPKPEQKKEQPKGDKKAEQPKGKDAKAEAKQEKPAAKPAAPAKQTLAGGLVVEGVYVSFVYTNDVERAC